MKGHEALKLGICAIFQERPASGGRHTGARERETEPLPLPHDTSRSPQHRQHGAEQPSHHVVHAVTEKRECEGRVPAHGGGGAHRYAKAVLVFFQ